MVVYRWDLERMNYLKENRKFLAAQFGIVGLHKHCLEIEQQAENRKRNMMTAIRKDPTNLVTEHDKAKDPILWAGRMSNFQHRVHETIYADLIFRVFAFSCALLVNFELVITTAISQS